MNLSRMFMLAVVGVLVSLLICLAIIPTAFGQNTDRGPCQPRIAILIDKSASADGNGVPKLDLADFRPLLDLMIKHGGQLGVGAVQDDSRKPLLRLFIDTPPQKPPERQSDKTNVFLIAQDQAEFKREMDLYLKALSSHQDSADVEINSFSKRLGQLLDMPETLHTSDVNSAVRRIEGFMTEPSLSQLPDQKFVIFCTDGQHNSDSSSVATFPDDAILILVPGDQAGVLDSLNPIKFENPQAAIRYIVTKFENNLSFRR